jgi:hypothetical protein
MISGALNGSTTPIAGATIQLQRSVGHTKWTNVPGKTATTSATGTYSITTSEATAATYLYRATYAGNGTYAGSNSTSVTVKVVSKESVQQDLAALRRTVSQTNVNGQTSQINTATKSALLAVLNAAALQLQYGKYSDATYTLQSKFLVRTDGCALRGTPDTVDLVRTCAAQNQLYPEAQNVVLELQALQGLIPTSIALNVSNTAPALNEPVTFTATLTDSVTHAPLANKPVTIYHTFKNVRYVDAVNKLTDANGQVTFAVSFSSVGARIYYATFAGDSRYAGSTSSPLEVTAG